MSKIDSIDSMNNIPIIDGLFQNVITTLTASHNLFIKKNYILF